MKRHLAKNCFWQNGCLSTLAILHYFYMQIVHMRGNQLVPQLLLNELDTLSTQSGVRFVQEIKIISKYRDCLKVLRIVICEYKDLTREFYPKYSFRAKSHFESLKLFLFD